MNTFARVGCGELGPIASCIGPQGAKSKVASCGNHRKFSPIGEGALDSREIEYGPRIGVGSTAEVVRGSWRGRRVAIKRFFKPITKMSARMFEDLTHELVILRGVQHENLLHMIGVVATDPAEIVTELCTGGSCFELIYNSPGFELSWPQTVKVCADTASGLRYMHGFQPRIIHRDLKSLNMLLATPVGSDVDVPHIKVCDFGQSCFMDGRELAKGVGTCRWQAPEVHIHGRYNEKVDVYSFGMVMFEVICSETPFEDESDAVVINELVRAGDRPDLDAVSPECPEGLWQLMVDCWDQDAFKRPDFEAICSRLLAAGPRAPG